MESEGRSERHNLDVPPVVRSKVEALGAQWWLRGLPELVASIENDWSLSVGTPFRDPTEAFVAEATLADGTSAVLKLLIPRDRSAAMHEITVLRHAKGDGCAELLRADEDRGALLLERLGPMLHDLGYPIARRLEILTDAAQRIWHPALGLGLPTGAEKGRWLIEFIERRWEELGRPCNERAVDYSIECAHRRVAAHDDERAVLVHGDVHEWNALQSTNGFKLVDPDGLLAEAEYDLGILMREDPIELRIGDPHDRSNWLAERTGLNETAIWEWGVVERVSAGLLATQIGLQPVGSEMLRTAEHVASFRRG